VVFLKHNNLTQKTLAFLDELDRGISFVEVKKEADEWRKKLVESPKLCKYPNWNLF